MEQELNEEQKSMMRSVSKNVIGKFDLNPAPLYTGLHGQIFHITNQKSKQTMILKVIWKNNNQSLFKNEKHIHESLKNRYIVQVQKCFSDQLNHYLVLQYCQKGNLRALMNKKLSMEGVRQYGLQIAKGIHYLHKNQIVHHDIKPQNILVTNDNQIKICDFALSARFEEGKNVKGCQGTLSYAPPEALEMHNEQYDIWSLGCLLYELATQQLPFCFKTWKEQALTLNSSYLNNYKFDPIISPSLQHLLKKLLTYDKRQRLTIEQVINHHFFTGIPFKQSKEEERPLVQRKRQAKSMPKSVEHKSSKESCSKQSKESHQGRENKQNTDRCNRVVSCKRNEPPNYRQMLQKKFKLIDPVIESSKKNSDDKTMKTKTVSQELKINKEKVNTMSLAQFNKRKVASPQKRHLSPLNTCNMRINPLKLKNTVIRIDSEGLTREKQGRDQLSQLINISCDGMMVRMRKGKKEKIFSLDSLPHEYYNQYQQCKKILKQIQSEQTRVTYSTRNFMNNKSLTLQIMYNNNLCIGGEDEWQFKDVPVEQFLSNIINIRQDVHQKIRNIYFRLLEMSKADQ